MLHFNEPCYDIVLFQKEHIRRSSGENDDAGFQTYLSRSLFLNDSLFMKIIPTDCGDIRKDFTCIRTYRGIYQLNEKTWTLRFHPNMAVHYLKSKDDANKS